MFWLILLIGSAVHCLQKLTEQRGVLGAAFQRHLAYLVIGVRLCARLGAMMVMWTALPEHDQAALEKQYDAVIFQWYHPEVKYK